MDQSLPKEIVNARIANTFLGLDSVLIGTLNINWPTGGVNFSFALQGGEKFLSTGFCEDFLASVIKTVGVQSWEQLRGQPIRVELDRTSGGVKKIGHIIDDLWFDVSVLGDHHNLLRNTLDAAVQMFEEANSQPQDLAVLPEPEEPKPTTLDEPNVLRSARKKSALKPIS